MAALPLQNMISGATTLDVEYRSVSYELGDGLSFRYQDGINATRYYGNIVYNYLNATNYAIVKSFLDSIGSWGTFDYQPPGETTTFKFSVSDKLQIADVGGGLTSLTIPCRQEWA